MLSTSKWLGTLAIAFVSASFVASPELRAYASTIANDVICAGCVGTADLAGNAVNAAKIKDGEVKAAEIASNAVGASEIATDAVGAAELQGVTKLIYIQCTTSTGNVAPGGMLNVNCFANEVDSDDSAAVTLNGGDICFELLRAVPGNGVVSVTMVNQCVFSDNFSGGKIGIIVFDK